MKLNDIVFEVARKIINESGMKLVAIVNYMNAGSFFHLHQRPADRTGDKKVQTCSEQLFSSRDQTELPSRGS